VRRGIEMVLGVKRRDGDVVIPGLARLGSASWPRVANLFQEYEALEGGIAAASLSSGEVRGPAYGTDGNVSSA